MTQESRDFAAWTVEEWKKGAPYAPGTPKRTVLVKITSHRALHKVWQLIGYDTATFYAPNTKSGTWLYAPIANADEVSGIKGCTIVQDRWDLRRHRSFA